METNVLLLLEGLTFGYDESPLFDNLGGLFTGDMSTSETPSQSAFEDGCE